MLISLSSPPGNTRGPLYMHQALAAMHAGNRSALPVTLIFGRHGGTVGLFCRFPRDLRVTVEVPLSAKYPNVKFERLPDRVLEAVPDGHDIWTASLQLKPDLFPIKRYAEFEDAVNKSAADPHERDSGHTPSGERRPNGVENRDAYCPGAKDRP